MTWCCQVRSHEPNSEQITESNRPRNVKRLAMTGDLSRGK